MNSNSEAVFVERIAGNTPKTKGMGEKPNERYAFTSKTNRELHSRGAYGRDIDNTVTGLAAYADSQQIETVRAVHLLPKQS